MDIRYRGCCVVFIFEAARGRDRPDVGTIHRGFIADSSPPGKVAAGVGLCRHFPLPSGLAPTRTASVWPRGRGLSEALLHLPTDEDLDHAPRDALARSLAEGERRLPYGRSPLPDLVAGEGNEVEDLGVPIGGYGRVVLDPHDRRGQPMVTDHLRGELLGGVGHGRPLVGGQLRADDDRGVLVLLREVDAHAAPAAAGWGGC